MGGRRIDRLGAVIALHPVEFAHHLGLSFQRLADQQALADEARPEKGHRKCDRRQTLSRDFCDRHSQCPPCDLDAINRPVDSSFILIRFDVSKV